MDSMKQNVYELICLDLDGTLLNSKHQISERTLETLRRIEARGTKIAIVTGRPGYDARYHAKLISDQTYFIGANGTIAGHVALEELILEESMTKNSVSVLRSLAQEIGVKPTVFTREQTLIHSFRDYMIHKVMVKAFQKSHSKNLRYIQGTRKFYSCIEDDSLPIQKAVFFIKSKKKAALTEKLLRNHPQFELAITSRNCFEITEKGKNKSHGIKKLAEHLGVKREKVIAFGDSENDREMLKYVGCGVAMGNAPETIKAVANHITGTNDEEGVAGFLQQLYEVS